MTRLAIYYTPEPDSPLGTAGASWLCRRVDDIQRTRPAAISSITEERMEELLALPSHYGFHGTVKPPFRLQDGVTVNMVAERLEKFAVQQEPFSLPPLEIRSMKNFYCLRPVKSSPQLQSLANDTVQFFDEFRKPASEEEISRRKKNNLTHAQERMLMQWGYPYVMDEFRFHLTLTGKVTCPSEKDVLEKHLPTIFTSNLCTNIVINNLSLFLEQEGQPFIRLKSFYFD